MNVFLFAMFSTLVKIGLHAESPTVDFKGDIYLLYRHLLHLKNKQSSSKLMLSEKIK